MDHDLLCIFVEEIMKRKDPLNHHEKTVANYMVKMIPFMNYSFSEEEVKKIEWCGRLHDMGKLLLEDKLLNHPRKLTEVEYHFMKTHVRIGFELALAFKVDPFVCMGLFQHHENMNGSGYPIGARGESICIQARMIRVADTYDAITSDRIYKKGQDKTNAIQILRAEADILFDPTAVEALIKVVGE